MTPAEREAQLPPLDENDEDRRVADGLRNMEFLNVYQVRAAYRDLTASYCCRERQLLAKISLISSLELTLSNATAAGVKQIERITALENAGDAVAASFKNFHRALCERFGYVHDEKDWERDQVSLIEYIWGELKHLEASGKWISVDQELPGNDMRIQTIDMSEPFPETTADHMAVNQGDLFRWSKVPPHFTHWRIIELPAAPTDELLSPPPEVKEKI